VGCGGFHYFRNILAMNDDYPKFHLAFNGPGLNRCWHADCLKETDHWQMWRFRPVPHPAKQLQSLLYAKITSKCD
jgi:hypothetical protein